MIFNVLGLELTNACSNRCKYCYNEDRNMKGNMSNNIINKALEFMNNQPINEFHISLLGGEPSLRLQHFFTVYDEFLLHTDKQIGITINTNGLFWKKKLCDQLTTYKNIRLAISLDGPKDIHDKNRVDVHGNGTYDILIDKIPMLLSYFPTSLCQATFTPDTIYKLSDSYFLAKELGFKEWYWAPDLYESSWSYNDFIVLNKQLKIIAKDYFNQNQIFYRGLEQENYRNCGNPRFANDSHILLIDTNGNMRIGRINATCINPQEDLEWIIGNVEYGINQQQLTNWINKYGINADTLYFAYNQKETCKQCKANHICYNTQHNLDNPFLFQIQCQQPRIQCEQKKALMNLI